MLMSAAAQKTVHAQGGELALREAREATVCVRLKAAAPRLGLGLGLGLGHMLAPNASSRSKFLPPSSFLPISLQYIDVIQT
jgi:hypothetical protein